MPAIMLTRDETRRPVDTDRGRAPRRLGGDPPDPDDGATGRLRPLKPADRKTLLALMTQLVDLNNEASRVPLRAEDALEHLGKSN